MGYYKINILFVAITVQPKNRAGSSHESGRVHFHWEGSAGHEAKKPTEFERLFCTTTTASMPGARHKTIYPPIRKVTYVEVKRRKGNYFKEVPAPSSPIKTYHSPSISTPSTSQHPDIANLDQIPYIPMPTKVWWSNGSS